MVHTSLFHYAGFVLRHKKPKGGRPMKYQCKCSLRDYLSQRLAKARKEAGLTQAKFSKLLMMDTRSYADLEHAQSLCCTLTFILYLCFCCKDVEGLVAELRKIVLDVFDQQSNAS